MIRHGVSVPSGKRFAREPVGLRRVRVRVVVARRVVARPDGTRVVHVSVPRITLGTGADESDRVARHDPLARVDDVREDARARRSNGERRRRLAGDADEPRHALARREPGFTRGFLGHGLQKRRRGGS